MTVRGQLLDSESDLLAALCLEFGDAAVHQQLKFLERFASEIEDPVLWLKAALRGQFKGIPIERVRACHCGSRDIELLVPFVFWNLLGVSQCRACGQIMTSPRLTPAAVANDFEVSYFDPEHPEVWGERRLPVFKEVLSYLRDLRVRNVLDVGCGYGHMLEFLKKHSITGSGCDISERAVEWGRENLHVNMHHSSVHDYPLPREPFDCVLCLDTLYYAPDPLRDLKRMREFVGPGGHLLLRLRNGSGVERRARALSPQNVSAPLYPAQHLWSFTPRRIHRLLERAGWSCSLIEPASYSETRIGPLLTIWQKILRTTWTLFPEEYLPGLSFNVLAVRR